MDIISILWQLGILSAILVFGIKIGLASGLSHLSKKYAFAIAISYGLGVLLFSKVAEIYSNELSQMLNTYNTWFFLIMATIMIISGLFTIREWKIHDRNTTTATCLAVIAPCPCCFGSIIASILMFAPIVGMGTFVLSQYVALALSIIIIATYFLSNIITKIISKPYPIILGNFMFFLGMYFLASSLILPNISQVLRQNFSQITIESTNSLTMIIVVFVLTLIVGIILNRRNNIFKS